MLADNCVTRRSDTQERHSRQNSLCGPASKVMRDVEGRSARDAERACEYVVTCVREHGKRVALTASHFVVSLGVQSLRKDIYRRCIDAIDAGH